MKKSIIGLGIAIVIWLILMISGNFVGIDHFIYHKIAYWIEPDLTKKIILVTNISSTLIIVLGLIVVVGFLLWRKKKSEAVLGVSAVTSSAVVFLILKNIVRRPRPAIQQLIPISGFSFPSGHATMSMTFYGFLIFLVYRYGKSWWKYMLMTFLGSLILAIGFTRIYLGVHYFSDVMMGFFLGLLILLVEFVGYEKILASKHQPKKTIEQEEKGRNHEI